MKRFPLLVLGAVLAFGVARADGLVEQVSPLRSTDAADHRFDDLAAFGRAIGDARYVVLGEQTHGEAEVFSLKVRLVEYLHEQMGFNVLALESGFYEGGRLAARDGSKPLRDLVPGNIFYMYSKTTQVRPLFDYLDTQGKGSKHLALATFDAQHSGVMSQTALVDDLATQLRAHQSKLPDSPDWSTFKSICTALLKMDRKPPTEAEQQAFHDVLAEAETILAQDPAQGTGAKDGAGYWRRIVASLGAQADHYWKAEKDPFNAFLARDYAMADNLVWLLKRPYAGQKVIIWTHDFHGQKASLFPGAVGMMMSVRKQMPTQDFYHVYFTGFSGSYLNFADNKVVTIGAHHRPSIESALHDAGAQQGFVDLKAGVLPGVDLAMLGVDTYGEGYSNGKPRLVDYVDGVFYLDHLSPATFQPGLN
ncbi:MAG: erythromycin esterase family protein [Burkholderiales bacterium]|nr:erythromycin esterase family protein [Burkholderiales bacterium]